jgi:hypothetical protein
MNTTIPVEAADPSKPCPIAWLDRDTWSVIAGFIALDESSDFVVCTAQTAENDTKRPVRALHEDCDVVLRGIPVNGIFYVTEVPEESKVGLRQDFETLHRLDPNTNQPIPAPADDGTVCSWYTKINREVGGAIDRTTTPLVDHERLSHSFYVEASDAVKLHIGHSEARLVAERHDTDHLKPSNSQQTAAMTQRLINRRQMLENDEDRRFLPIHGASTKECDGELVVLGLCRGLKMIAKLHILGTLPLLCRLDVPDLDDDLSTMTTPYNLKSQLSYSLGKYLALVPAKWLIAQQHLRFRMLPSVEYQDRVIPDIQRIRDFNSRLSPDKMPARLCQRNRSHNVNRFLDRDVLRDHFLRPNEPMPYHLTSFKILGPMLVYSFFSSATRSLSLTSDVDVWALIDRMTSDQALREEFSLTGLHVSPAGPNQRLSVRQAIGAVPIDTSPESDLFGGLQEVF